MRRLLPLLVVLVSIGASGCGDDEPTTPTSASTEESVATTRLFAGTLAPRGSAFYSFTIPQSSDVLVTLASLTAAGDRAPLPVPLVLGLGVPRGTACATTSTVETTADLSAQIRESRAAGVHCASLVDPGNLSGNAAFAIRLGYYQ